MSQSKENVSHEDVSNTSTLFDINNVRGVFIVTSCENFVNNS